MRAPAPAAPLDAAAAPVILDSLTAALVDPFLDFSFMRRALAASCAVGLGAGPIGVLMALRRMSLIGDAMAHAMAPGAAIAFLLVGLNVWAMGLGGMAAALLTALAAAAVARTTPLREDQSMAIFYLLALAAGVALMSAQAGPVDLLHILFGSVLGVEDDALILMAAAASVTVLTLALFWRPILLECFDPGFLRAVGGGGALWHGLLVGLAVINLAAAFQTLGALLAVGLMTLPAAAARFWGRDVGGQCMIAAAAAVIAGAGGLLLSFHFNLASGPAIVLAAGGVWALSLVFGPVDGVAARLKLRRHLDG